MSQEVYKSIDNKSIVYPLVYYSGNGDAGKFVGEDYGVHRVTGEIYSKKSGVWKRECKCIL